MSRVATERYSSLPGWRSRQEYRGYRTNWVVAIDVESLSRPEHQNRKEVGSGDEGDDEGQAKDARILSRTLREDGMLRKFGLPQEETHQQDDAEDERCKD
ncbi:hypothetical protein LTR57_025553, partial [Friedmanniomyces endolithicus]